jgi:predicted dehydrogenase
MIDRKTTRRRFLKQTTTAATTAMAAPWIVPASALGRNNFVAPSERIVMGCIGTGGRGRGNLRTFMGNPDVQLVAVCDVDGKHRDMAKGMVDKQYGNEDCATFADFRELLKRDDIDAVSIATPDHWHALASVAAANAGKDIYCEKPLANSIAEGRAICNAVDKNKRILQTGSHERSNSSIRFGCELVRNGRIGELKEIIINLPCDQNHHKQVIGTQTVPETTPTPEGFDYNFWLGHTAKQPYTEKRCHFWWRFILAYGGGEMTDRGAHVIDIAQLGAGFDDTGPVKVEGRGVGSKTGLYDAFMEFGFANHYANGVTMYGSSKGQRGVKFVGSEGSLFIHIHGGKLEADPASILKEKIGENEIQLGRSPGHHRNFLDCVKSRETPLASAEVGHRTATICHLNNIAMLMNKPKVYEWNPKTERITNDADANALCTPKMRSPWSL